MLNRGHGEQFFFQKSVGIDEHALAHRRGEDGPVRLAELRPLGADDDGIRAIYCGRDVLVEFYFCELSGQLLHGRVKSVDLGPGREQGAAKLNRGAAAECIGAGGVNEAEQGDVAPAQIAEAGLQPA